MIQINITGPESSGKTTLALDLCAALGTQARVVPEFARVYLHARGATYQDSDYFNMLHGQRAWEQWYAQKQPSYLICDTDWAVYHVWAHDRFGNAPKQVLEEITEWQRTSKAQLTVLCAPDMPWQPDPLREHPYERERLYGCYLECLTAADTPFVEVRGSRAVRVEMLIRYLGLALPA